MNSKLKNYSVLVQWYIPQQHKIQTKWWKGKASSLNQACNLALKHTKNNYYKSISMAWYDPL